MIMWICRWTYKMLDRLLDWLERVQWEMDAKRQKNERKKKRKETARIKNAKKVLIENGYTFERDWQDIEYKGNKYTPILIEECSGFQKDSIIITARRTEQG